MSSSGTYNTPCAACKFLRRKCMPGCTFAPYFPPEEPQKFFNVHKIFGASNVTKILNEVLPSQREDAVNSLAYEAEARIRDPVYGCVGTISNLQRQVQHLQKELDAANANLIRYGCGAYSSNALNSLGVVMDNPLIAAQIPIQPSLTARPRPAPVGDGLGGGFYQNYPLPYPLPWSDTDHYANGGEGGGGGGGGRGGQM
ncbi:hypothetical protein MLD38_026117 [Melastoma candidum]|uniref:Uncharacterized protein n=1 Tax=Melastoma candidum TaxID=119954 RepID=A0ACB9P0F4_9MYRT|nr:hypothetical protein MLD38_026117 [Melastoma candidum]